MGVEFGQKPSSWLFERGVPSDLREALLALDVDAACFRLGSIELERARKEAEANRANNGR